jgi:biopolymer transport protein ExbB
MNIVESTAAGVVSITDGSRSGQTKKKRNSISWVAPLVCIVSGYLIWRFLIGADANFTQPDLTGGFWPHQEGPRGGLARMYQGGIIVPILIGALLTVLTFVTERFLAIGKAAGRGSTAEFIRKIQFRLANDGIEAALWECERQKGSLGNVMKAGLRKYKEMTAAELDMDQKVLTIQKEVEEAASLELPRLEKNLVFLSTIASVATLMGLFGTVIGMITSFAALGGDSGGGEAAQRLSQGISEALYNTALGIGTSAISIIMYNIFTSKVDAITYGIDEGGFTLTQGYRAYNN